ncbi:MAG: riboflavin synthase [Chloroflexi bacterium]|nr:riboflavin synthase [Chloroflexota bacterium]MYE46579.1 riboflavin synthase [Chloroflexota bacterium]
MAERDAMFTGIIEEVGEVRSREGGELVIACRAILEDAALGDSIAVNGVDLTIRAIGDDSLTFDVMPETFRRSNLGEAGPGARVNLERSVRPMDRLSGHIVRGVVETTCTLDSLTPEGEAIIARYRPPAEYLPYILMKGPVCLDGASLTVMARDEESFSVSLVQYTQEHTNLTSRQPGDSINLETDLLARYVEQLLDARSQDR